MATGESVVKQDREIVTFEAESPEERDIASIIDDLGAATNASVQIFREGNSRNDLTYLTEMDASEFKIAMLQVAPYYGGKFRVQVKDGGKKIRANRTIKVEAMEVAPTATSGNASFAPSNDASIGATIAASIANSLNAGLAAIAKSNQEMIIALMANRPKEKSTREMLEEMQLMKSIMGSDRPALPAPTQNPMDIFTTVKQVVEIANSLKPDPTETGEVGPMNVLYKAVEHLLPIFSHGIQAQMAQAGQTPQAGPPIANQQLARPENEPLPNPSSQQGDVMSNKAPAQQIAGQVLFLCSVASRGASPVTYAEMILDNAPVEEVISFLERPTWFADLTAMVPEAAGHQTWFESLKEEIFKLLTDDPEPGTQTESLNHTKSPSETPPAS
jgi:hypothetical protein